MLSTRRLGSRVGRRRDRDVQGEEIEGHRVPVRGERTGNSFSNGRPYNCECSSRFNRQMGPPSLSFFLSLCKRRKKVRKKKERKKKNHVISPSNRVTRTYVRSPILIETTSVSNGRSPENRVSLRMHIHTRTYIHAHVLLTNDPTIPLLG